LIKNFKSAFAEHVAKFSQRLLLCVPPSSPSDSQVAFCFPCRLIFRQIRFPPHLSQGKYAGQTALPYYANLIFIPPERGARGCCIKNIFFMFQHREHHFFYWDMHPKNRFLSAALPCKQAFRPDQMKINPAEGCGKGSPKECVCVCSENKQERPSRNLITHSLAAFSQLQRHPRPSSEY